MVSWEDQCKRDRAWDEAKRDLIKNSATVSDVMLQNCLKYGTKQDMEDTCWTNLLIAYPQS